MKNEVQELKAEVDSMSLDEIKREILVYTALISKDTKSMQYDSKSMRNKIGIIFWLLIADLIVRIVMLMTS